MPILPSPADVLASVTVVLGQTDEGEQVWAQFFYRPIPRPLYSEIMTSHVREGMTITEVDEAAAVDLISASLVKVASSSQPEAVDLSDEDAVTAANELWEGFPPGAARAVYNAVKATANQGAVTPFGSAGTSGSESSTPTITGTPA